MAVSVRPRAGGSVTDRAKTIVREQARTERLGVRAMARISARAVRAALRAYRMNRDVIRAFLAQFNQAELLLAEGMETAHYRGFARARRLVAMKMASDDSAFRSDVAAMKRQADLAAVAETQITATYKAEAAIVLARTGTRIAAEVLDTMVEIQTAGLHVRQGVKVLADKFVKLGITPRNSFALENIFRTETQKAYGAGRWQANQAPKIQEILWGYEYVTAGDARVRPTHEGLDGVKLPKDDPEWAAIFPPNGFACRCQAIELFEEPRGGSAPPADTFTTTQDGKSVTVKPGADKGFRVNFGEALGGGIAG